MTPNLAVQNRGFVSVHTVPLVTFGAALLHAAAPGPHPVSSTAQSHIPNQTFTHTRWRLRVTRSSCASERSFCSQACHGPQPDGWWRRNPQPRRRQQGGVGSVVPEQVPSLNDNSWTRSSFGRPWTERTVLLQTRSFWCLWTRRSLGSSSSNTVPEFRQKPDESTP